ncbi:hypothetical protein LZZ85_26325 [Terrimonas sp. NA20]|uniref:Uncharacterized protein n=1 Tax=Terrimonas ginsenosidimutans TaxID=2908004 RepID=A0ABS9KZS6_9BACT|nr:RHS repeat-associated core domain-containing protein [Terrimonas ginsenosidimutans]MCG2617845.1 hypothetical protein [Terrimonas ginsenosidimutans]
MYGFNGKKNDNEVKGEGNQVAFENRIYDPWIARWMSLDPLQKKYPNESHYAFVSGNLILHKDADGSDKIVTITIKRNNQPDLPIRRTTKGVIEYSSKMREDGMYFREEHISENIILDLRNLHEKIKPGDVLGVISIETDNTVNRYMSGLDYALRNFKTGNSGSVAYGFRLYGDGTDMEWQDDLPTAAHGTESVDISRILAITGFTSGNPGLPDVFEGVLGKIGGVKVENLGVLAQFAGELGKQLENLADGFERMVAIEDQLKKIQSAKDVKPPAVNYTTGGKKIDDPKGMEHNVHIVSPGNERPDTNIYTSKPKK